MIMAKKKLIFAAVIILLLIAGIIILLNIDTKKDNVSVSSSDEPTYTIMNEDASEIAYVEVTNSDGTIKAVNLGNAVWTINNLDSGEIDTSKAYSLAATVTDMTSKNKVGNDASDSEKYGFDNPKATAVVTRTDGSFETVILGDMSPTLGEYFVMKLGDDAVYTVYSYKAETLMHPLSYYQEFNRFSVDIDDISEIKIVRSDETIDIRLIENITDKTGNVWEMTEPYQSGANDDYIDNKILEPIGNLAFETPIEDYDDSFFENSAVVTLTVTPYDKASGKYKEAYEETIETGKSEGEKTYVKYKGKVFSVANDGVAFAKESSFNIVSKLQALVDITKVRSVTVEYSGVSHTMHIEHENYEFSFEFDGKTVETADAQNMYQEIIALPIDAVYKGDALKETILKISYKGISDADDTVIEFREIDDLNCAVVRNGVVNFTIKKNKLADFILEFESYAEKNK